MRLESLPGWSWDPFTDQWEEGFTHLKEFLEREGNCLVRNSFRTEDGHRLGSWVARQRSGKATMEPGRRMRLESLPGWSWDPFTDQWEEGFSHLKEFADREGHCRLAIKYRTEQGYRLGQWINVQRTQQDKMDPDRRMRLESLPGWSWDPFTDQWEEGFS
jgi:hypothetical protein